MDYLNISDSEVYEIIQNEYDRQKNGIELIASENFVSIGVNPASSAAVHKGSGLCSDAGADTPTISIPSSIKRLKTASPKAA